jgi:transcriptional regulator with XRE-family HTH domain
MPTSRCGLSQEELSGKAGIARCYLAEIEGRRKPGTLDAFRKVARVLGLTVDDLLPERETETSA